MSEEKLQHIFEAAGVDALFIEADFLRRYLTGFYSTDGYVILDGKGCRYVADLRYFEAAEKALAGSPVEVIEGSYKEAMALLAPYKTLGVPYPYTDLASAEALKNKGFALKDCMPALKDAMIVKSEKELSLIQTACTIAEDGFLALLPDIKEGMTESEVAALLEYNMRKFGASGTSFETIVAFGAGASVPHHETGNTKLKFGDPILIDFGCKAEGYCSDITRTFLFGDDKKHEDFKRRGAFDSRISPPCPRKFRRTSRRHGVFGRTGRLRSGQVRYPHRRYRLPQWRQGTFLYEQDAARTSHSLIFGNH